MRGRLGSRRNMIIFSIIIAALGVLLLLFSPFILYILGIYTWSEWHPICCSECLAIHNNSYIDVSKGVLVLFLSNCGRDTRVVIYKVELDDVSIATYRPEYLILKPDEEIKLELQLSGIEIEYGRRYRVEIYTLYGNVYRAFVEPR